MGARILVMRFGSLGDVVLTTPVLRALKRHFEDATVTFATKAQYTDILDHHPAVDRIKSLTPAQTLRAFVADLRADSYDVKLDLHASLRTFLIRRLLGNDWRVFDKQRWRRFARIWLGIDSVGLAPMAHRYGATAGLELDRWAPDVHTGPHHDSAAREIAGGRYVVVAPGSRQPAKRWPSVHWEALCDGLSDRGLGVVGVGTKHEAHLIRNRQLNPAFGTSLGVTAALMRGAELVVANDSGPMHLATAVGTRVYALFGPTSPDLGYRPHSDDSMVLQQDLPCRPCSTFGRSRCPLGHHRCLTDLLPTTVLEAVDG